MRRQHYDISTSHMTRMQYTSSPVICTFPNPQLGIFIADISFEKTPSQLTTELASSLMQKKIINQLTKVNNCVVACWQSITCKSALSFSVKPAKSPVNNFTLTTNYYPLTTKFYLCTMNLNAPEYIPNYIGGELQRPLNGNYMDNINPATGEVYSHVPDSDIRDIE